MTNDYGHWNVDHDIMVNPAEYFGFCYMITNRLTGKRYIGRKYLRHGGLKKSKMYGKDTNWKTYMSSSDILKKDIRSKGKASFDFEIISWHKTKADLHFTEQVFLHLEQVSINDKYYNESIPSLKYKPKNMISQSSFNKIGWKKWEKE